MAIHAFYLPPITAVPVGLVPLDCRGVDLGHERASLYFVGDANFQLTVRASGELISKAIEAPDIVIGDYDPLKILSVSGLGTLTSNRHINLTGGTTLPDFLTTIFLDISVLASGNLLVGIVGPEATASGGGGLDLPQPFRVRLVE